MITRNGVFYDLKNSSFRYKSNGLIYVFSSKLHLEKFKQRQEENRNKINSSLTNRFNLRTDVSVLADLVLYRKIETRGFLIATQEGKEICKENIIFGGGEVIIVE